MTFLIVAVSICLLLIFTGFSINNVYSTRILYTSNVMGWLLSMADDGVKPYQITQRQISNSHVVGRIVEHLFSYGCISLQGIALYGIIEKISLSSYENISLYIVGITFIVLGIFLMVKLINKGSS